MFAGNRVRIGKYNTENSLTFSSPHTFLGEQTENQAQFLPSAITVVHVDDTSIEFELQGTSAPIANTLRRTMMEAVPTMAIEDVDIICNTSVLQDESLCSRIGLVPLKVDARQFEYPQDEYWRTNPRCVLKFVLKVTGTYANQPVYSDQLKWEPIDETQRRMFAQPPAPVHGDILLAKIKTGQFIHVECYAIKGVGRTHAKFNPTCPATYRMYPIVEVQRPIAGEDAAELARRCPGRVFDIEDGHLVAARPRQCTACRECIREERWEPNIFLGRKKDHFIFSVESTGTYAPQEIVREALGEFQRHCLEMARLVQAAHPAKLPHYQGGAPAAAGGALDTPI